jgi:hypothetical protein
MSYNVLENCLKRQIAEMPEMLIFKASEIPDGLPLEHKSHPSWN